MIVAQDDNRQVDRAIANVGLVMGEGVAVVDLFSTINVACRILGRAIR